jgi:dihydroflavonol-4-reductase
MRAFVTGASGFIGARLVERLLERGWDVTALVHSRELPERAGLRVVRGDIRDIPKFENALAGADALFHLASALGASRIPESEFLAINAEGTRAVLETARRGGVKRTVHFSSAGVLGHVAENIPAPEDHGLDPRDRYDRTKLRGEEEARAAVREGLDAVIIRPGWVYGPGDRRTFKLIRAIARGRFILVGQGRTRQTPVYIDDLVDGVFLAWEKGRPGEIYNLAGPDVLTVGEMAAAIASACGRKLPRFKIPLGMARPAAAVMGGLFGLFGREAPLSPSRLSFFVHPKPLDIAKARRELGYAPGTDFAEGLARTAEWGRAHRWL